MTEVIAYTLSVIKGHCGVTAGESSDLSLGRPPIQKSFAWQAPRPSQTPS